MRFPFRTLEGNPCFVRSTSDPRSCYFNVKTGLESQVTPGMAMKSSACTKVGVWAIFRRAQGGIHGVIPLIFISLWFGWLQKQPSRIREITSEYYSVALSQNILMAFPPCIICEAEDCIPEARREHPTSTRSFSCLLRHPCLSKE